MSQTALIQIDPPTILVMHNKPTRVKDGAVVGVVPGTAIVPVIVLESPEHDYRTHRCEQTEPVAFADRVEIQWKVEQHPNDHIVQEIKQCAGEVISSRFSQVAQLNMLADAQLIAAEESPTDEMNQRSDYYRRAYAWIRSVRAISNAMEAALIADGTLPNFGDLEVPFV